MLLTGRRDCFIGLQRVFSTEKRRGTGFFLLGVTAGATRSKPPSTMPFGNALGQPGSFSLPQNHQRAGVAWLSAVAYNTYPRPLLYKTISQVRQSTDVAAHKIIPGGIEHCRPSKSVCVGARAGLCVPQVRSPSRNFFRFLRRKTSNPQQIVLIPSHKT